MAVPANTFGSYAAVGIREDLSELISTISPTKTPFRTGLSRGEAAHQRYVESQKDALAAVDLNNAVIEGDDATTDASTPTERIGNHCQIMDKVARVTGSLEDMKKAGRRSELAYQMAKRSAELNRDQEGILLNNQASVTGDAATARKFGAFPCWLETNVNMAGDGANGGFSANAVTARTDGTQRRFTQDMLQDVSEKCFNSGGEPTTLLVGTFNKRVVSTFTGYATATREVTEKRITASVSVYEDDFNVLKVVPDRFARVRDALLIDWEHVEWRWFRTPRQIQLAVTGDSVRRQILHEGTLEVSNEAAHGGVFDLTSS